MSTSVKGLTVEIGGNTTNLQTALNRSREVAKGLQTELNYVNKALKLDPSNVEMVRQKKILLKSAIEETRTKLDAMKQAQAQADELMQNGVEVDQEEYRKLQREIAFAENRLQEYETELVNMGNHLETIGTKVTNFGDKLTGIGKNLAPLSTAVTALGSASAYMAVDFEDAMAKVNTIADTSAVPLEDLEAQIMELSNQTGVSASEIADNVYNAISAGQQTGDAVNFVSNATNLARAGFADTGASLDVLTTIMNAYGLEASEVVNVSDMLIQTQNLGKTTVAELASSMGKVIPTANAMGVGLDNLTAAYTITTAKGIATAESTTYINSMLNELGKSSTNVGQILKEKTGKSFQELMEDGQSLGDVLGILEESAQESGTAFNEIWSSAEAGKAAMSLLSDGVDGFNGRLVEMQGSSGATGTALGKLDTTSHEIKVTINTLKNTLIDLGKTLLNTLAPILKKASEQVSKFSSWFKSLNDEQKETIVKIGLVIAALAPLLMIIGKVISIGGTAISTASKIMGTMKTLAINIGLVKTVTDTATASTLALNTAFLASPITWLVLAIGGLVAALAILNKSKQDAIEAEYGLTDAEKEHIEKIHEQRKAYEQMDVARKDAMSSIETEYTHLEELKDELNGLIDSNHEIKEGYEDRASFIINELAQALNMEEEEIRDIIQANGELGESIDDLIEKKKAQAILEANEEAYREALQNQKEALSSYVQAYEEFCDAEAKAAALKAEANRYKSQGMMQNYWDTLDEFKVATERSKELQEAYEDAEYAYIGYQNTISNYEGLSVAIISGDVDKINNEMVKLENGFITAENGTKRSLENQVTELEKQYDDMRTAVKEGMPGVTQESVDQMAILVEQSKNELAKFEGAAEEIGQNGAGSFANGVASQSDSILQTGVTMTNTMVSGATSVDTYFPAQTLAQNAVNGAASTQEEFRSVGAQWTTGLSNGMLSVNIGQAVTNLADTVMGTMRSRLDIHSPSRKAYSLGDYFVQGFINAIADKTRDAVKQCTGLASESMEALNGEMENSSTIDVSRTLNILSSQFEAPIATLISAKSGAAGSVYNINNHIEIQAEKVDREHIGEIVDEINRRLGDKLPAFGY